MNTNLNLQHYASLCSAGLLARRAYGHLRLSGEDRIDFLQRMTTNDMAALRPGQATVTVLTSPTARILFVFTVLCRADDLLLLPAGSDQTAALAKHLRGQIFFMDNVIVHDENDLTRVRLVGEQAHTRLGEWHAPAAELSDSAYLVHDDILILRQEALDLPGFELLIPVARADAIVAELEKAGFVPVEEDDAYTAHRVELGRPAAHAELTDEYSPLEAGLAWTCAENKGCYTGQEIIARQITYDKVTRTLVGLQADAPLEAGATVSADGKAVGTVTTSAYSPTTRHHIALAVIRRPHNEPGNVVTVQMKAGATQEVRVLALELIQQAISSQAGQQDG